VGATASLRGRPKTAAFAAAKAAQRSLAQSLARQSAPEGIHVALLIIDGSIDDAGAAADQPEAKRLRPEDIAAEALHLTRQDRSAWTFELDLRPLKESW
jgi:NAD(P)-dependent dehydrogenase (short-subunit alcohol dehydrogenase family)